MTASDFKKMLKQLKGKPAKYAKFLKHNAPKKRSCGLNLKRCKICGRRRAVIGSYGLMICRQCFREVATSIGFKKYR